MVDDATVNYNRLLQTLLHRATTLITTDDRHDADPQDHTEVLHLLLMALKRPEQWSDARDLLLHLNSTFERDGRYAEWAEFLSRGIEQSEIVGDLETRAILYLYRGNLHRIQGELQSGLAMLHEARTYFETTTGSVWYARSCNGLARLLQESEAFEASNHWAEQALTYLPMHEVNERAVSYRMLGGNAARTRQWEAAYACFSESLRLWREGGDPRLLAFGLTNLSVALRGREQFAEAESALTEAIQNFQGIGDEPNEAIARIGLGNVYLKTQQWQDAIREFHQVEQMLLPRQDKVHLAGLYNNWGMAYAGQKEWKRAIRAYQESIRYNQQMGRRLEMANVMDNLAMALYDSGDVTGSATVCRDALALLATEHAPKLRHDLLTRLAMSESGRHPDA